MYIHIYFSMNPNSITLKPYNPKPKRSLSVMLLLWGNNSDSQLGDCSWSDDTDENDSNSQPDIIFGPTPCRTFMNLRVTSVSCGSRHTLAISEDGVAWSWGWGAR